MVCIAPDQIYGANDVTPHPHIAYAYQIRGEHQHDGWIFYSNPYMAEQPTLNLPPGGSQAVSMGRRTKARGNVTLSFLPSKQVLSDRMVFHIDGGSKLQRWKKSKHLHKRIFRTQKFTPKVCDLRQIQCYPKCAIHDKFHTKKVKKV